MAPKTYSVHYASSCGDVELETVYTPSVDLTQREVAETALHSQITGLTETISKLTWLKEINPSSKEATVKTLEQSLASFQSDEDSRREEALAGGKRFRYKDTDEVPVPIIIEGKKVVAEKIEGRPAMNWCATFDENNFEVQFVSTEGDVMTGCHYRYGLLGGKAFVYDGHANCYKTLEDTGGEGANASNAMTTLLAIVETPEHPPLAKALMPNLLEASWDVVYRHMKATWKS